MQCQMKNSYACAAESFSASYNMPASNAYFAKTQTAIIIMMAVVLSAVIHHLLISDIIIAIIHGAVTLVIVRRMIGWVSRP